MADAPIIPGPGDIADERGHFHPAPGRAKPSGDPVPAEAHGEPEGQESDPPGAPEAVMDPNADANAPDPSRPMT